MCLWKWGEYCNESVGDVCLHGPCCVIFLVLGAVQVSTGVYYYLSVPVFKLLFNAFIGFTSLIIGIVGLIILCVCLSNVRKYELILYCSTGVIFLNAINLVFLEFGQLKDVFSEQYRQRIKDSSYDLLPAENGRMVTSVTALISVLVGFIESQFTFCCLNRVQYLVYEQRLLVKTNVNPEASADLEYVLDKKKLVNIPRGSSCSLAENAAAGTSGDNQNAGGGLMGTLGRRRKSKTGTLTRQNKHQYLQQQYQQQESREAAAAAADKKDSTKIEVYTQSWVFKENAHSGQPGSFSSVSSSTSPEMSPKAQNTRRTHQRKVSEISQTPSDRQAMQMTSFSRSVTPIPSPVPHEYECRTFGGRQQQHSRSNSDYLSVASTPKHYENTMTMTLRSPNRLTASLHQQGSSNHYHQTSTVHQLPQPSQATIVSNAASSSSSPVVGGHDLEAIQKKRSTFASNARTDPSYASLISELEESLSSKLNHHHHSNRSSHQQSSHYHNVSSGIGSSSNNNTNNNNNNNSSAGGNPNSSANAATTMKDSLSTDTLTACSSSKSSKEGEFSKELELALQLIQELETPSECNPMNPKLFSLEGGGGGGTNGDMQRTGSDKTLSALSLEEFTAPVVAVNPNSTDTVV